MPPRLTDQAPVLLVSDMRASLTYWTERVGFSSQSWGEPPHFAILTRDRCHVMLSQAPRGHEVVPLWRISDKLWNADFWVDDARALFAELKAAGASIDYGLCEQPYGVLEFGIQDPDGHDIAFGEVVD